MESWHCFVSGCVHRATWRAFDDQFCDAHSPADLSMNEERGTVADGVIQVAVEGSMEHGLRIVCERISADEQGRV